MQLFSRPLPHYLSKIMPMMTVLLQLALMTNADDQCFMEQRHSRYYKAHSDIALGRELLPYFSGCNASEVSYASSNFSDHTILSQQIHCQSMRGATFCQQLDVYAERNASGFDRIFAPCLNKAISGGQNITPTGVYIASAFFIVALASIMFCIQRASRQNQQRQPLLQRSVPAA